jgi:hypothetical protein
MSSITGSMVLHGALVSAKDEGKTGHLHILASLSGTVKDATLVVKSGELLGCNYFGKVGKEAVRILLQANALKALFVRHDVSRFTPHSGIPSVEDILRELHNCQSDESVKQQPTKQASPKTFYTDAGKLNRAAEILTTVIGEEETRLQIRDIMKKYSTEDEAEHVVEACIDLASSYVGEMTARLMFDEIAVQAAET